MAYKEIQYARTEKEAQEKKAWLDGKFGGFPCDGKTVITPCRLIDRDGKAIDGFEVACTHYGTN